MKISEIARMAGVSSAAVSRYLNGGSISEEKKERIKKVIEETGYVPNPTARSLRQQRTDSIGIIFPKVNSDSVSNLIEGVSTVLSKAGYLAMPIVVCGQNHPDVTCVYHDDKGAAKEITRYMLSKGRKKLAYIGAIEKDISVGVNRREGVEEAMREAQLDPELLVRSQVFFTASDGYDGMNEVFDSGYVPDGVICATDTLAVGAMKAIRERGYSIPGDISIAGIGGGFAGTIITPALTTVKLFHLECGERGAQLLLSMIEQHRENPDQKLPVTHTMFGYSLIERESV